MASQPEPQNRQTERVPQPRLVDPKDGERKKGKTTTLLHHAHHADLPRLYLDKPQANLVSLFFPFNSVYDSATRRVVCW